MFVISRFVYDAMSHSKSHATNAYLKIHSYAPEQHKQTFYRFRYGARAVGEGIGAKVEATPAVLSIKRGAAASIWSLEGFELSERVLGIFGHSSELFLKGLELVHSPFIEPAFKGQLQLVVRNTSDQEVKLSPGDALGKVMFFDISDTILSADDLLQEVQTNAQNKVREQAIHEMSQALTNLGRRP